ncbi:Histone-lysine N-methyltransferase, H3 lysine-9 specific SUVH4 [Camellia lanceoleosa]|uniref:Histone-lysine N-methyltransferase, H3 lysine-9 specific SUVH4 n=1 Tax=Camellia lanceoleosa TaxID=1840588 RepID=A0ACC0IIF4_9ERIC|nr:Histone-lysine N-methyltransferase, H3 lysine-9 specific SUVH4 [Camellia lanceoleosa]
MAIPASHIALKMDDEQMTSILGDFSLESCVSKEEVDAQQRDDEQFITNLLCFKLLIFFFPSGILQDFNGYTLPLTIAIVLSGQYKDDLDNCDDIVYTGQGGNNLLSNKRQVRDQVILRGHMMFVISSN